MLASAAHSTSPAPPPLEAYGELPTVEDMAISPAGKLGMLATSAGKRVLIILDSAMKPVSVSEVGNIKVRDIEWIGDEAIMVERSDTQELGDRFIANQGEFMNAMIIPADGKGQVRTVFGDDKTMMHAEFGNHGFRKVGGKWIGLFIGRAMTMGQGGQPGSRTSSAGRGRRSAPTRSVGFRGSSIRPRMAWVSKPS